MTAKPAKPRRKASPRRVAEGSAFDKGSGTLRTVESLHAELRRRILSGEQGPGVVLSQVQIAAELGVSRTPLREAMRMLQEEGLIEAARNQRSRVAAFHLDDLEAISAQRITLGALATYLTVSDLDDRALGRLESAYARMVAAAGSGSSARWRAADRDFHSVHYQLAPSLLRRDLERLEERSSLYRAVWSRDKPHRDRQSQVEHAAILEACRARKPLLAMREVAVHRARIGISVMSASVPTHDPVTIRTALSFVNGELARRDRSA